MAQLSGKPLIYYVLKTALELEPELIAPIVGHCKESVIDYINSLDIANVRIVEQKEQLGTGHAVAQTKEHLSGFQGDALILSGDVPLLSTATLRKFIENHKSKQADLSVLTTETQAPSGYGRIVRSADGSFLRIVEHKDATADELSIKEINSGVYLVKSSLLYPALSRLKSDNAQKEYYLTDIIADFHSNGKKVEAYLGAQFDELQGVNSVEDLARVQEYFDKTA
jgi:UDP-N-acetylglucosamine diphosphorylase/glucosamine-1-phosphate N-acetyltransferase